MLTRGTKTLHIIKVIHGRVGSAQDDIVVEEPLEIRLEYGKASERAEKNISVTMRTPGHDAELATGFLFTEGIINSLDDIEVVDHHAGSCLENRENILKVVLNDTSVPFLQNSDRNFYTTSSCGVCGKGSINAIKTTSIFSLNEGCKLEIAADLLYLLPGFLQSKQSIFSDTGGLHASALFNNMGELLQTREDVGRHNALDKLIGYALQRSWLPLTNHILVLSGRASFELVQKAAMAGVKIIASVGAPSSLAVELAAEFNITLVGFLRDKRFNIYTGEERIIL